MKKINILGDVFCLDNDLIHNDNGPAIEFKNGVMWWMQRGKLHRENGPAIDSFEYWLNGDIASKNEIKNIKRNKWIDRSYENK